MNLSAQFSIWPGWEIAWPRSMKFERQNHPGL